MSPEKVIKMKDYEDQVNKHLQKEGLLQIKLVDEYKNVYLKSKEEYSKAALVLKGVLVSSENKPQLWLE